MSNRLSPGRSRLDRSAERDVSAGSPARVHEANELMRDGLRNADRDLKIAFFCECENRDCYAAVWLTCTEYDEHVAGFQPIVVAGHPTSVAATDVLSRSASRLVTATTPSPVSASSPPQRKPGRDPSGGSSTTPP